MQKKKKKKKRIIADEERSLRHNRVAAHTSYVRDRTPGSWRLLHEAIVR